jgi:hypothetical protein
MFSEDIDAGLHDQPTVSVTGGWGGTDWETVKAQNQP